MFPEAAQLVLTRATDLGPAGIENPSFRAAGIENPSFRAAGIENVVSRTERVGPPRGRSCLEM